MLTYRWQAEDGEHELGLVRVTGTRGDTGLFRGGQKRRPSDVRGFYMGARPVTQALWRHGMGSSPSRRVESRAPVENVSWNDVAGSDGFLERINSGAARVALDPEPHHGLSFADRGRMGIRRARRTEVD